MVSSPSSSSNKRKLKMNSLNILLLVSIIFFSTDTTIKNGITNTYTYEQTKMNDLHKFMDDLGHKESTGRYDVVSKKGYLGKYQFNMRTLKDIGIQTTKSDFLKNPSLQDSALVVLLKTNKQKLHTHIINNEGRVINDTIITESGILAAAHLVGAGSVSIYFKKGIDKKDGNGVRLTDYLTKFSGYELEI